MDCVVYLLFIFSIFPQMVTSKVAVIKSGVATEWVQEATSQMSGGGSLWSEDKNWYKTCGTGDIADFWLILKHSSFDRKMSDLVYVDVEFKLIAVACFARKGGSVPCYSNLFEVYVHYGKPPSQLNKYTLQNIVFVGNTSNNDGKQRNETFTFPRNNASGVTLAIRSRGACGYVYRFRMYYKYCEETFSNNIKFEKTFSPPAGAVAVFGNCSENSFPSNSEGLLKVYCDNNGTWINNGTIGCSCDAGYQPSSNKGCTGIPSEVQDIEFRSKTDTSIEITWNPPSERTDSGVLVDIHCFKCDCDDCSTPCVKEKYFPSKVNISGNNATVSNLEANMKYLFVFVSKYASQINETYWSKTSKHANTKDTDVKRDETQDGSADDSQWYLYIIIALFCGVGVGVVVTLITIKLCRKCPKQESKTDVEPTLEPTIQGIAIPPASVYQELDLADMNRPENYAKLIKHPHGESQGNDDEAQYEIVGDR